MKRASELFTIEEWASDSPLIEKIWTSRSVPEAAFMSVAVSRWHIIITTRQDVTQLAVRGPETLATVAPIPSETEFFGIVFRLGTFMPTMPLVGLVDQVTQLPADAPNSVLFEASRWEIPTPESAEAFVSRLVRQGLLVRDPVVTDALQGDLDGQSTRTLQRRVARATGLTRSTIRQIARAEKAVKALGKGLSPQSAAHLLGYADQAHLTRSLKRFIGQTPTQISLGDHWTIDTAVDPRRIDSR